MLIFTIVAVSLSPLLVTALLVDDWSRDLTTNRAATAAGASQEPRAIKAGQDEVAAAITKFASSRPGWSRRDEKPLPEDSPLLSVADKESSTVIHLVRTTSILRFQDDIWGVLEPIDSGSTVLHAESRSRLGRGDLGQNPRNLRELLDCVQAALAN